VTADGRSFSLEWRSTDPDRAARRVMRRLVGADVSALRLRFATASAAGATLSFVAGPPPDDRIVIGDGLAAEPATDVPFRLLALAIATLELGSLGGDEPVDERALGARGLATDVDGRAVVLLEPTTEGRLAGSLARFGPGPCGLYLAAEHRPPLVTAPERPGILGPTRLILGGPAWGPHLLVVAAHRQPAGSSTIAP
jgi:hypothetical protein